MTARSRSGQRLLDDMLDRTRPVARPFPWTVVWRWRYELVIALVLGAAGYALLAGTSAAWLVIASVLAMPPLALAAGVRARLRAAAWIVITPHRVRRACAEARIQTCRGRLPAVVRTSRAPFGERVLLWCPAGTTADDLDAARPILRAACWAADVRVVPDRGHRQLVVLEVVRPPAGWPGVRDRPEPPGSA